MIPPPLGTVHIVHWDHSSWALYISYIGTLPLGTVHIVFGTLPLGTVHIVHWDPPPPLGHCTYRTLVPSPWAMYMGPPVKSQRTTIANGRSMRNFWVRTQAVHLVRYRTNCNTLLVAKRCESPYCIGGPWSMSTSTLAKCSFCGQEIWLDVTWLVYVAKRVMPLYGRS